jgi:hypothetical protein
MTSQHQISTMKWQALFGPDALHFRCPESSPLRLDRAVVPTPLLPGFLYSLVKSCLFYAAKALDKTK